MNDSVWIILVLDIDFFKELRFVYTKIFFYIIVLYFIILRIFLLYKIGKSTTEENYIKKKTAKILNIWDNRV